MRFASDSQRRAIMAAYAGLKAGVGKVMARGKYIAGGRKDMLRRAMQGTNVGYTTRNRFNMIQEMNRIRSRAIRPDNIGDIMRITNIAHHEGLQNHPSIRRALRKHLIK